MDYMGEMGWQKFRKLMFVTFLFQKTDSSGRLGYLMCEIEPTGFASATNTWALIFRTVIVACCNVESFVMFGF